MLQIHLLEEEGERVLEGLKKRGFKSLHLVEEVIKKNKVRKETQFELDENLSEANSISKKISLLVAQGRKDEIESERKKTIQCKERSKELQRKLSKVEQELKEILYQIPNIPHHSVKEGFSAEDNEIVFQWGEPRTSLETDLPHWELAKKYDLIDFESGVKVAGSGFPFYKGKGARLKRALVQFFLDRNIDAGYLEINPPHVVNEASALGTGNLPDKEKQMYFIEEDKLYLIPTAEVPITNIYRDVVLNEKDLPIRNTAFSQCYRREAGSYGAHVRGLNRLHQFEKVEIVCLEKPENSYATLDEMVEHVKKLLYDLELPFRVLRLCSGDMGFTSALTYDFEVWSSAQKKWLEVSSVSNFETFQSNRLKCRYKSGGKTKLVHTLNGSSLALPRIISALLENNQTEKGVEIPEKIREYTKFGIISQ